jgi:hypothetical protein
MGPYAWQAFDSDHIGGYGIYIVAREYETHLRIRVLGETPDYSLEMDFDVERSLVRQTKSQLFANMFERLLPAVGATDIRDTNWETQTNWIRRLFRQLRWRLREW